MGFEHMTCACRGSYPANSAASCGWFLGPSCVFISISTAFHRFSARVAIFNEQTMMLKFTTIKTMTCVNITKILCFWEGSVINRALAGSIWNVRMVCVAITQSYASNLSADRILCSKSPPSNDRARSLCPAYFLGRNSNALFSIEEQSLLKHLDQDSNRDVQWGFVPWIVSYLCNFGVSASCSPNSPHDSGSHVHWVYLCAWVYILLVW